ncbi:MAG: DUF2304 domain-containing protein [Bifidobacteriaceae bacterium]|nr:DUF2304 domain-containing protein [Bifidobacteriaceae bacterium]
MFIKIALIVAVMAVALFMLRGQGARRQALRRLGLLLFAALAVVSIVFPDSLTTVAQRLNVGRGADLLLYVLIVVFFSYVASRYVRDRRSAQQLTALARRLALDEAPPPRECVAGPEVAGSEAAGPAEVA